jgi:hypothetical protein
MWFFCYDGTLIVILINDSHNECYKIKKLIVVTSMFWYAKSVNSYDNMEAISASTKSVVFTFS